MSGVEILALVFMIVGVGVVGALAVAALASFFSDEPLWPFVLVAVVLLGVFWGANELLLALGFDGCIGACSDA